MNPKYVVSFHQSFPNGKESWSWHLKSANHRIICQGHGFASKATAKHSAAKVILSCRSPDLFIKR